MQLQICCKIGPMKPNVKWSQMMSCSKLPDTHHTSNLVITIVYTGLWERKSGTWRNNVLDELRYRSNDKTWKYSKDYKVKETKMVWMWWLSHPIMEWRPAETRPRGLTRRTRWKLLEDTKILWIQRPVRMAKNCYE